MKKYSFILCIALVAFADTVVDFERAKAFYADKSALKDRVEQLEDD